MVDFLSRISGSAGTQPDQKQEAGEQSPAFLFSARHRFFDGGNMSEVIVENVAPGPILPAVDPEEWPDESFPLVDQDSRVILRLVSIVRADTLNAVDSPGKAIQHVLAAWRAAKTIGFDFNRSETRFQSL